MKSLKKVLSLVLVVAMVMACSVFAYAGEGYTVTTPNQTGHTFDIYQIFTGTVDGENLTSIKWGKNGKGTVDSDVAGDVLNKIEAVNSSDYSDSEKLAVIKTYADLTGTPVQTAVAANTGVTLDPGYYLVKDNSLADDADPNAYNLYMVVVLNGDVTLEGKTDMPTLVKKLVDTNDSTGDTSDLQDSADYDIGDSVPFTITADLPDNVTDYPSYPITITDKCDDGLDFDDVDGDSTKGIDPVKVTVKYTEDGVEKTLDITDSVTITKSDDGKTLTVVSDDLVEDFVEKYKTTNKEDFDDAVSEYATTNKDALEEKIKAENPSISDEDLAKKVTDLATEAVEKEIAELVNDAKVVVEDSATLNEDANVGSEANESPANLTYPNNPNEATPTSTGTTPDDTVFIYTFALTIQKTDASGNVLTGAKFTIEKVDSSNAVIKTYETEAEVNSEGKLSVTGIDDGIYKLTETYAPDGYQKLENPIFITITAEHNQDDAATNADALVSLSAAVDATSVAAGVTKSVTFTDGKTDGSVTTTVPNVTSSNLPTTGGMGTTVFYVVGITLILAALCMVVIKKKKEIQ